MLTSRVGLRKSQTKKANTFSSAGTRHFDVAVIGAGPYGLSVAAHLKNEGLKAAVYGKPMDFWATKMPAGMLLRSPRAASNLADPTDNFTLDAYETAAGVPRSAPLALETFVEYGRWFQQRLVSDLDAREAILLEGLSRGFRLTLDDGECVRCGRVIIATGVGPFQRIPAVFCGLAPYQVSHCYSGCDVTALSKKRIAVIGAGQSALECAALLYEAGADVEVIARTPSLRWIGQHAWLHSLGPLSSLLYSKYDVGPAGISRLVAFPNVVRRIPLTLRDRVRTRAVRPAGSKWLPPRLRHVQISTNRSVAVASGEDNHVRLQLDDGSERVVDHVLLGTGYSVDIARYGFLSPQLFAEITTSEGYPILGDGFESSVPGLHFLGATAARSFGPLLYFVAGTEFASRQLTSKVLKFGVAHAC